MEAKSFQQYSGNTILSRTLLFAGLLLVIWNNYITPISDNIQWIIFAVTILIAGIPHGALDHLVAKQNSTLHHQKFSSIKFYTTYLTRMALYGICWYFFPAFSLLLFIVLSAFHFGETDLSLPVTIRKLSASILQTNYGLLIVLVLLLTHSQEVLPILSLIEKQNTGIISTIFNPRISAIILIGISVLLLLNFAWIQRSHPLSVKWYLYIFIQTVFLLLVIISLPLPLAFAFYFGCWHSLHSLENIRQHLSDSNNKVIGFVALLKKCIPYSIIALTGIAILIILSSYLQAESVFLFFFFIGIAILTVPHLEVMSHMYKHLRKKDTIST